jgi:hypothetical protein
MHSQSFYKDVNQVVNQAYMPRSKNEESLQEAPMGDSAVTGKSKDDVAGVIALITRAMETGQDELFKQAKNEAKSLSCKDTKKNIMALIAACPAAKDAKEKE